MSEIAKFLLRVSHDKALAVLKALGNESRIKIMRLVAKEPLGVTEIARLIGVSQPTATVYIKQLEEAGLISYRFVKTPQGVQKISYTLYDAVEVDWTGDETSLEAEEYTVDMPVGHYAMIECSGRSLLASKARVIASHEDISKFFNPVRMEAELLVMEQGRVRYLFPYNIPATHTVQSLMLSMEVSVAYPTEGQSTQLKLEINGQSIGPIQLDSPPTSRRTAPMPEWLPPELSCIGRLLLVEVGASDTKVNSQTISRVALKDLALSPMKPIDISLLVEGNGQTPSGLMLYGQSFGIYRQDIRTTISHLKTEPATDSKESSHEEGTRRYYTLSSGAGRRSSHRKTHPERSGGSDLRTWLSDGQWNRPY